MATNVTLGNCCVCGGTENVRNIICLPRRAPVAGTGWGCVVCDLPSDGAVSVVCDDCLRSKVAVTQVCSGYPATNVRVSIETLSPDPFDHDMRFHQDEVA
jgi:hypothetical protein